MGRKSRDAYDNALGLREAETDVAYTFEAEFSVVTARTIKILSVSESPDRIVLIDGTETGVELTSIRAGNANEIVAEMLRLAHQKHDSYKRRGIFDARPIILLGHLDWPTKDVEGPALYDLHEELGELIGPTDFDNFEFNEIWLMDDGPKYTSRHDPRAPADFFCFAPAKNTGFWERPRKRRSYWGSIRDFLA
jgi:hypothetical protein